MPDLPAPPQTDDQAAETPRAEALDPDRFAAALVHALGEQGESQRAFAARIGLTQQSVNAWTRGTRPSTANLRTTLDALGIAWADVRLDQPPSRLPARRTGIGSNATEVVVYDEIRVTGGGDGFYVGDLRGEEARRLVTPKEILAALIGFWPPAQLCMVYVEGDSMVSRDFLSDGLRDGHPVLFEPPGHVGDFVSGQRYVVQLNDELIGPMTMVKRLYMEPGGVITLASDNLAHRGRDLRLMPDREAAESGEPGGLVVQGTGAAVRLCVVGRVVFPRETDSASSVRALTEAVEHLSRITGVL